MLNFEKPQEAAQKHSLHKTEFEMKLGAICCFIYHKITNLARFPRKCVAIFNRILKKGAKQNANQCLFPYTTIV